MLYIIGHTEHSLRYHPYGLGEIANTKLLAKRAGVEPIDLYDLLGGRQTVQLLAHKNLLSCLTCGQALHIPSSIHFPKKSTLLIISHFVGLAALVATGALRGHRVIARALAFHPDTNLFAPLYAEIEKIFVQSPLTIEAAISQGIPREKLFYLPCQLPDVLPPKRRGEGFTVGCAVRFEYRRNIEYLIWAFAKIASKAQNAKLFLKGDFEPCSDLMEGEGYTEKLKAIFAWAKKESWFQWDSRHTTHWETLETLASFDLHVHLGGSQDPPNTVIEALGIGIPQLLLKGLGPHHLFEDLVAWTPNTGVAQMRQGVIPFFIPDATALADNLLALIQDEERRNVLAQKGLAAIKSRFAFNQQLFNELISG